MTAPQRDPAREPRTGARVAPQRVLAGLRSSRVLAPLRHRDFALLWAGDAVSFVGDGMTLVAMAFQALAISSSAASVAAVWLVYTAGVAIASPLAGLASDRRDRRRILLLAEGGRMAVWGCVAALSLSHRLDVSSYLALILLAGLGSGARMPAFAALVPSLVGRDELPQANSLTSLSESITRSAIGPAIGGLVVGAAGPGTAFAINALTFAVSLACIARLAPAPPPQRAAHHGGARQELVRGLRYVGGEPWLWATFTALAISVFCVTGSVDALLPVVVSTHYGDGAAAFGLILGSFGVGTGLAALWIGSRGLPRRPLPAMYAAWSFSLACVGVYGLLASTTQALVVAVLDGAGTAIGLIVFTTLIQQRVPAGMLGRVSGLSSFVQNALSPASFALVAPLSSLLGVRLTLVGAGFAGAVVILAVPLVALRAGRSTRPSR